MPVSANSELMLKSYVKIIFFKNNDICKGTWQIEGNPT